MRISDWSSDVCSSDLQSAHRKRGKLPYAARQNPMASVLARPNLCPAEDGRLATLHLQLSIGAQRQRGLCRAFACFRVIDRPAFPFLRAALETLQHDQPLQSPVRSEEHTSELQSLMRISYAVFCLKKKNNT